MTKTYTDGSSQTIQIDPDSHLRNYGILKVRLVSSSGNQTDPCNLETCKKKPDKLPKGLADKLDDQSDDDEFSSLNREQELQRRLNPATPKDFEMLQSELLQWRRREERKIIITSRDNERKQEMKRLLLKKESHILRKIDQLKNSATDKCKREKIEHMMDMMSRPKQWEVSNGSTIGVDTPETCRARELKAIYYELNKKFEKAGTRIEILERTKALVEKIDQCALAKDLCSLLDRELQMMHRGTDLGPEFMDGMRKRIYNQFNKLVARLNNSVPHPQVTTANAKFQIHKPNVVC